MQAFIFLIALQLLRYSSAQSSTLIGSSTSDVLGGDVTLTCTLKPAVSSRGVQFLVIKKDGAVVASLDTSKYPKESTITHVLTFKVPTPSVTTQFICVGGVMNLDGTSRTLTYNMSIQSIPDYFESKFSSLKETDRSLRASLSQFQVETGVYMATSFPAKVNVVFKNAFSKPPIIFQSMFSLDVEKNFNLRISVGYSDVTTKGFTSAVSKWADTYLFSVYVQWLAISMP